VVKKHEKKGDALIEQIDRFAFYERAKKAYAIVATTEKKLYGCMIIKKGVIR
jgi:L-fucose mutarotase